jgi:hypothetical protein
MRRAKPIDEIEGRICELQSDFENERNPLDAFEALHLLLGAEKPLPVWLRGYLIAAAAAIMNISIQAVQGASIDRPAEAVGKAFGFGSHGPGRSGWFRQAAIRKRDRDICRKIRAVLEKDPKAKLDALYYEIAYEVGVHPSTVGRAWRTRASRSN